ncbi:MAG: hypothetical protein KJ814_04820 [Proteobacteria bacterium]|nr:hypothetical protein [Pseudomonadota bacterium]
MVDLGGLRCYTFKNISSIIIGEILIDLRAASVISGYTQYESFELLLKFGKSSFLRKQESSPFKTFWIPAYAGITKWGYFSKLSIHLFRERIYQAKMSPTATLPEYQ